MSDTTITAQEEKVDLPSHEYSPLQQWQIAFIYAFTATFNHHQDISPSYHKLPFFTPQVNDYQYLLTHFFSLILRIGFRR